MSILVAAITVQRAHRSFLNYVYGNAKDRQSILGRAALSGYGDLRKAHLPPSDEEVRVWYGFGITYLQAIILRKHQGKWSAVRLLSAPPNSPRDRWKRVYPAPQHGWPALWQKAETLGIWSLPDDSTLPQNDVKMVLDGFSYVVETMRTGRYRAYAYNNPSFQTQWPEAKQMVAIGKLLDSEFPFP